MNSLESKSDFFKGTFLVFILKLGGAALAFLCQVLLSKTLGIEAYGALSLFFSIVNVLVVLPLIGMDTGIIRSVASDEEKKQRKWFLVTSLKIVSFILLGVGGLVTGTGDRLLKVFNLPFKASGLLVLFVIVISYSKLLDGFLQGEKKTVLVNILSIFANNLLKVIILGIVFIAKPFLAPAIWVLLSVEAALLLVKFFYLIKNYHKVSTAPREKGKVKEYALYCLPLFFVASISIIQLTINKFILGNLMGNYEVGILRVCENYSGILGLFVLPFITLWPVMAEYYSQNKMGELQELFKQVTLIIAILTLPALVALTVCAQEILQIFGVNPSGIPNVSLILFIFFIGTVFDAIIGPAGALLNMTKYSRISLLNNVLLLGLSVLLSVLLIPALGLMGAAIASSVSMVFINVLNVWQNTKLFHFFPYGKSHLMLVGAALPVSVLCFLFNNLFNMGAIPNIILTGVLAYGCYFMISLFFFKSYFIMLLRGLKPVTCK